MVPKAHLNIPEDVYIDSVRICCLKVLKGCQFTIWEETILVPSLIKDSFVGHHIIFCLILVWSNELDMQAWFDPQFRFSTFLEDDYLSYHRLVFDESSCSMVACMLSFHQVWFVCSFMQTMCLSLCLRKAQGFL